MELEARRSTLAWRSQCCAAREREGRGECARRHMSARRTTNGDPCLVRAYLLVIPRYPRAELSSDGFLRSRTTETEQVDAAPRRARAGASAADATRLVWCDTTGDRCSERLGRPRAVKLKSPAPPSVSRCFYIASRSGTAELNRLSQLSRCAEVAPVHVESGIRSEGSQPLSKRRSQHEVLVELCRQS